MSLRPIIRIGDKTSHGGTVLEGFASYPVYGKNASGMGHKVYCPLCKGSFPIVEGVSTYTVDGIPVSVEGMHTDCGAVLIASQGIALAEWSSEAEHLASAAAMGAGMAAVDTTSKPSLSGDNNQFDEQFHLVDAHDNPLPQTPYRITASNGQTWEGVTDDEGLTQRIVTSDGVELSIEVFQSANKQNVIE